MPYIIAVSNEKGGVAKTTTTFSLGAALTENSKNVLLVDLDHQGNLSLANGFEPGDTQYHSGEILLDGIQPINAIRRTNINQMDIIPSNPRITELEQIFPNSLNYGYKLKTALASGNLNYDFIILDCPPSIGAITTNALNAADLLIIPTQAEYFSAYALRDMMTLVRWIRKDFNPELAYRILITMLDQRNRTHRTIREQLQQTFGIGLFETVIEVDTRLRESAIVGIPITQYSPNSRGSLQHRALAQELIDYVHQLQINN